MITLLTNLLRTSTAQVVVLSMLSGMFSAYSFAAKPDHANAGDKKDSGNNAISLSSSYTEGVLTVEGSGLNKNKDYQLVLIRADGSVSTLAIEAPLIIDSAFTLTPADFSELPAGNYVLELFQLYGRNNANKVATDSFTVDTATAEEVVEIAAGMYHICARTSLGASYCWGFNYNGVLGLGLDDNQYRSMPTKVEGLDSTGISAGDETTCSLLSDGSAKCWGWNIYGQLGQGLLDISAVNRPLDSFVGEYDGSSPRLTGITQLAAGRTTICALLNTGTVQCIGDSYYGQLGNGATGHGVFSSVFEDVYSLADVAEIAGAETHFCARHHSGEVSCWGGNDGFQLGSDTGASRNPYPVKVPGIDDALAIGVGHGHSCAIRGDSRELWCWGTNDSGQLGFAPGDNQWSTPPTKVPGLSGVKQVVGGSVHTCALLEAGDIYCMGWDGPGVVGNGENTENADYTVTSPAKVVGINDARQIVANPSGDFNCALREGNQVSCWGELPPFGEDSDGNGSYAYEPKTLSVLP